MARSRFHEQGGPQLAPDDGGATTSGLHIPSTEETFNINDPQHRAMASARIARFGMEYGKSHPDVLARGKQWYDVAHQDIQSLRGDIPMRTAAGLVSVVSGGSDWEKANKRVLEGVGSLEESDWQDIRSSTASQYKQLATERAAGKTTSKKAARHADISSMLAEKAPILSLSSNEQLIKAHSILRGADPESVLDPYSSPKTARFYHGLLQPRHRDPGIAVDYRMADVVANQMRGTGTERGLGTGHYKRPGRGLTSYQHHEQLINEAGAQMQALGGRQFQGMGTPLRRQAAIWSMAKDYEMTHPEAKAGMGPVRRGQKYY